MSERNPVPGLDVPSGAMRPIGYVVMQHPVRLDPHCLATLKHYRSLIPLAQEARKPMFALKAADGAIGGHAAAVQGCHRDFQALARTVAERGGIGVAWP